MPIEPAERRRLVNCGDCATMWNFCRKHEFHFCALGENVMLSTILIIILILLLVGALPTWPYSSGWGYYPGGTLGLILIIVIILALIGRI
jgi:Protein of unknown function (DUF3309)